MLSQEFLSMLLKQYEASFDIYSPFEIENREYPAYGYFFSHGEKYVLTREAKLWEADSYEHILFQTADAIDREHLQEMQRLAEEYIEPFLIRNGEKFPAENHMYSYITLILLSDQPVDKTTEKIIKGYKFHKNYKFSIRGYSLVRILCVDVSRGKITANRAAKPLVKTYKKFIKLFYKYRRT